MEKADPPNFGDRLMDVPSEIPHVQQITLQSDLTCLACLQTWFEEFCDRHAILVRWDDTQRYRFKLAMVEGFTNTVRHAHEHLPAETAIEAELALEAAGDRCDLTFNLWDRGEPFDPTQLDEPEPGTLQLGGYGWFLLRRLCDRVTYSRCSDERNRLTVCSQVLTDAPR